MGSKDGKPIHLKNIPLSMVDVISLYPYVMLSKDNYYPAGEL
jgi:hypothetical protein